MSHKTPEEIADINDQIRDEADLAQAMDLYNQDLIQEKARQMNKPETHPDFDGIHCIECGCDIHPKRLEMKKIRCVDCQEFFEKSRKR